MAMVTGMKLTGVSTTMMKLITVITTATTHTKMVGDTVMETLESGSVSTFKVKHKLIKGLIWSPFLCLSLNNPL